MFRNYCVAILAGLLDLHQGVRPVVAVYSHEGQYASSLRAGGRLSALTGLVFLAMLATIAALVMGVGSMAGGGSYDDRHSHHWMALRVALQAVAVGLLFIVLLLQIG